MKKNIFFAVFTLVLLLSVGLYFLVDYICTNRLNNDLVLLKKSTLSTVELISPEIKTSFLKSDDIALLYNIEKISKLNNISETFVINKNLEILIHNDSTKWNKKYTEKFYETATQSTEKLVQQITKYKFLYSLPINNDSTLCIIVSLEQLFTNYNSFKIKLYVLFSFLVVLIFLIMYKLLQFLFLRPFNKTKQYLTLNETKKKTIYWELVNMAKKDIVDNNFQVADEQLEKENLKELFNFIFSGSYLTNEICIVLDTYTKVIFCKDKDKILFDNQNINTHIVNATTNVELVRAVSKIVENPKEANIFELSTSNLHINIFPVKNTSNVFIGIIITANLAGI